MTGNKILDYLLELDHDTCMCELLELIKQYDNFLEMFSETEPTLENISEEHLYKLKGIMALVEYKLFTREDLPKWMFDKVYYNDRADYRVKRMTPFENFKLIAYAPIPFRKRNVYFNLEGLERM